MMSVEAERAALCAPFDREIAHPQQGAGVERDRLTAFEERGDDVRRKEAEPGRFEEDGDALLADGEARAKVAEARAQRCALIGQCGQLADRTSVASRTRVAVRADLVGRRVVTQKKHPPT